MANGTNNLAIGVNDRVEPLKAVGLAFLHVLAMDLYVCPIVLAAMLGLDTEGTNQLIQICFFTAGIASCPSSKARASWRCPPLPPSAPMEAWP